MKTTVEVTIWRKDDKDLPPGRTETLIVSDDTMTNDVRLKFGSADISVNANELEKAIRRCRI